MIKWLLENWYSLLTSLSWLGIPIAWFTGRKLAKSKEQQAQSDSIKSESEAVQSIKELYSDFVEDHKERYEELKDAISFLKKELMMVKKENVHQRDDLKQLRTENIALNRSVANWEKKYIGLKKAFDSYKKKRL